MTIIIIFFNNEWLKEKLASKCSLPVPIELIAVVLGTVLSRVLFLGTKYGIRTIGHIPTGFPGNQLHTQLDYRSNIQLIFCLFSI